MARPYRPVGLRSFVVLAAALVLGSSGLAPTAVAAPAETLTADLSSPPVLTDGQFIQASGPEIYVIAGGAPVYVDSFAPYGYQPAVTRLSYPLGLLPSAPADGTFVATAGEGKVYRFVNRAPVWVDSWAPYGGPQPLTWVSPRAISEAGSGRWSNLRQFPRHDPFVATLGEGKVYRIVNGAPVYVDSWDGLGPAPVTWVSPSTVRRFGDGPTTGLRATPPDGTVVSVPLTLEKFVFVGGALLRDDPSTPDTAVVSRRAVVEAGSGEWSNLRRLPADGSFVATRGEGKVYQIVGGAALYVESWAAVGGPRPVTWVSRDAISTAGRPEAWSLLRTPADGTVVATAGEGRVHQFIGGAPVHVDSWSGIGGVRPWTWVSPQMIASAGSGEWSNLNRTPADGSFLATNGDGRIYQIVGGAPVHLDSWFWVGGPRRAVLVSPATVAGAGTGLWSNLNRSPANSYVRIDNRLYQFVGGAPVDTRTGPAWGFGQVPEVGLNFLAGVGTGPWSNVLASPRDGTFAVSEDRFAFRYAGGTPFRIEGWDGVPEQPVFPLRPEVLHHPDRPSPADGTMVRTTDGRVYRYAGGAAVYVTDWDSLGGWRPTTEVSAAAIDLAGTDGWPALRRTPADGTLVSSADGTSYVMAGGAPIWINDWQDWGGPRPTVTVSAAVLETPGQGAWSDILPTPADGTQVLAGGTHYRIVAGRLEPLPPNPPAPQPPLWDPAASTVVPSGLVAGAGTGRWSAILPPL